MRHSAGSSGIKSQIKYLLPFLLLVGQSDSVYAEPDYDWVLEQYGNDENSAKGQINGEEYIAVVADQISSTDNQYKSAIFVFRKTKNHPAPIAEIDLEGQSTNGFSVNIKNDSIYLEWWVGHNGWWGARYQFKQINHEFKLIGAERHVEQLLCYLSNTPGCEEHEVLSGTSYNFLTSSAICWQEIRRWDNYKSKKMEWIPSKNAVSHQMKFKPIKLPLLDGFPVYFGEPAACYFDGKNKLVTKRRQEND